MVIWGGPFNRFRLACLLVGSVVALCWRVVGIRWRLVSSRFGNLVAGGWQPFGGCLPPLFLAGSGGLVDTHLRSGLIHIENRGFGPISPVSESDTLDVYHGALIRGNAGFRSVSEVYQSVLRAFSLIHIDTPVIHLLIHFSDRVLAVQIERHR